MLTRASGILLLLLSFQFVLNGQVLIERNVSGNSSTTLQFGAVSSKRVQQLYTPSELVASIGGTSANAYGMIDEVFFMYNSTAAQSFTDLEVYIGQTSATALTTNMDNNFTHANMVQVRAAGSFTIPAGTAGEWFSIPLTNPFLNYDPKLSIVIETRWTTNPTSLTWAVRTGASDASGTNRKMTNSSPTGTTGSAGTTRANFRFEVTPTEANDAGILAIISPTTPSNPGLTPVEVQLQNFGASLLTTAQINWSVNDVLQTPYSWTGGLTSGTSTNVPIGAAMFAAGTNVIKAWTSLPNAQPDAINANDTSTKTVEFCTAMTGTVTVNSAFAVTDPTSGQYKSFTDLAAQLAACGINGSVVVNVVPNSGPYIEQVIFNHIPNTSSAATVTINGNGNTISSGVTTTDRYIIRLDSVSFFTLSNLIIAPIGATSTTQFMGVHVFRHSNNITINNVTVDMTGITTTLAGGIVCSESTTSIITQGDYQNIILTNNQITGGGYGISFFGNSNTGLVIDSNSIFDYSSNGIYTRGTSGAVLSNNFLNKRTGATNANGIQLAQSDNSSASVFNNRLAHEQTSAGTSRGIYIFGGGGHKIFNNVISNIKVEAGTYSAIASRGAAPEIYFNTIIFDHTIPSASNLFGLNEESTTAGTVFKNNIISITQSTSGSKAALNFGSTTTSTTDYNVYWVPGGQVVIRNGNFSTLAAWQAASSQDANSIETDPTFQTGTAIPTSGVINDKGTTIAGISTDITGAPRNAMPDPGAYEFAPSSNDAGVTGFVSPALPHCGNTLNVQFVLTNAGAAALTSAVINWSVNGAAQPVVNWTGNIASGDTGHITLGTIPVSGSTTYEFTATVSSPNGQADPNATNNSFTFSGFRRGMGGAFTIDKNGSASATNYTSFQGIANDLAMYGVCGPVTISVLNGPYTEQVSFDSIPGSGALSVVTLNGNGQELNFGGHFSVKSYVLQLNNVHHFIVENLVVKSTDVDSGRGIFITGNASNITLRGNTVEVSTSVTTPSSFPIIASGANYLSNGSLSTNLEITSNTLKGGYIGIQLTGESFTNRSTKLTNSLISNNIIEDWYLAGVQLSYTDSVSIVSNQISRPTRTAAATGFGSNAAVSLPSGSTNYLVDGNKLYNFHGGMAASTSNSIGVYMSGTSTARSSGTLQNNLIYGMTNNGAQYGLQVDGQQVAVNIYHNTIVLDQGEGTASSIAVYFSNSSAQTGGANVMNNIFYVTRGGTGVKRIFQVADSATVFTSDYNVTWLNPSGGTGVFGRRENVDYATLADWQANTGKDVNSIHADPLFINTFGGDFTPSNSAVDASAMNTSSVGVVKDFFNKPRNAKPDPGAIEFSLILYVFNGNGNWDVAANWVGNMVPPTPLPAGSEIIIDPSGSAVLNVPYTIAPGGKLTVKTGKTLVIPGDLIIQ